MTSFFIEPYPDELLYSMIARYHIRSGNTNYKETIKELFGKSTISATVDLPCHIDKMITNLNPKTMLTSEDVILEHTLFPYYASFMEKEKAEVFLSLMKSNGGGKIHTKVGITAGSVQLPEFLRFCPDCNSEDQKQHGEFYWHREFQLPGIYVCSRHARPLLNSKAHYRGLSKHAFLDADAHSCSSDEIAMPEDLLNELKRIAEDIKWVVNNYPFIESQEILHNQYVEQLKRRDLATCKGKINCLNLINEFSCFYSRNLLRTLNCEMDTGLENNWLLELVRKNRKSFHPTRHILLMRFLSGSVEKFITGTYSYLPFGEGPRLCLNPAAEHYKQAIVERMIISQCYKTRKPVGTFECDCGFIYARKGPDNCADDKFKIGRIKEFGPVWTARLKELSEDGRYNTRAIARMLKVDSKTVKLQLGKKTTDDGHHMASDNENGNAVICENMRLKWIKLMNENPELSKTQLRNCAKGLYIWLYRNDRCWLEQQNYCKYELPRKNRIDWGKRDAMLLRKIQDVVSKELEKSTKPIKLSVGYIGKQIGELSIIQKKLDKLSLSRDYLMSVIEDREAFFKRRIDWAITVLEVEHEDIQRWRIIKAAGMRDNMSEELEQYLTNLLLQ